jgi:hypothetical protein
MKFGNFENWKDKGKKVIKTGALILGTSLAISNSTEAQSSYVPDNLKTAKLYEPMKASGAIDSTTTEIEFSKFTDEQMKDAVEKFKKATGRISPEEFEAKKAKIMEENPNATSETIDVVKYKVNTKETKEEVKTKQEGASYAEWYAKQEDGKSVVWPVSEGGTGKEYKIDRDTRNKSLYASAPKVNSSPVVEDTNEAMASTSEAYVFAEDHFKNQNKK